MWRWLVGTLVVLLLIVGWLAGLYNGLVGKDQLVKTNWAQIDSQLQRRYDLIPNLVETVKGYATHEKELFENVAAARSAWAGAKSQGEKVAAANQAEGFLGRLIAVAENYPQLQASANFRALQDELAGTENRIAVARMRYNEAVQSYNVSAKSVPTVIFVGLFGFDREKMFFAAPKEAQAAPKVKF
ncbi:MAG TPA: LemA family protein [Candidatus Sulfotelmatobacter sp.]|nr:LemA family protein [Candidatus Sulfotelmatobacter sp.]